MKKSYDWDIKLFIQANHKRIEIVASIHTNIHKLKIEIAKKMGLSVLDSHIDLYYNGKLLKATSTLMQNQVQNFAHITANIARHKIINEQPFSQFQKKSEIKEKKVKMEGLSIVCCCTSNRCINYNQDIQIQYGFGVFPIQALTANTKCQFCPYKSQYLRPSMLCKQIKVSNCFVRLKGSEADRGGIPVPKDTGFTKIVKQKNLHGYIQERPWNIGMELIIKHL